MVRPGQDVRVTWLVQAAAPNASLVVDEQVLSLRAGEQQVSVLRPARGTPRMRVRATGEVAVIALVAAPAQPEIPPPAAEPWDAGVTADGALEAASPHSP
jgi:hypothetical protein